MIRIFLLATVATLATAKPGLYKENEDFQYSRSSTDEGSKSGFYGAQRGNMGGNYERAHNMDGLAQHQMGGLVKQVQGELGDGSKTRAGSVFTAANSRGVYGSGHYDLSNLQGRNFQEGVSYADTQSLAQQSHSSLNSQSGYNAQSSASNSAAYRHAQTSTLQNGYNGYNGYQYSGQNGAESNLQQADNLQAVNQNGHSGYDATGYYSQAGYNGQSAYDQSAYGQNAYGQSAYGQSAYDQSASNSHTASTYGTNAQNRLVSGMPVKVVLRPGTRVIVPIATQTYDSSNSAAYDHNSVSSSNSINQNSDAELIRNQNQQNRNRPAGAKHYESSYSYHKEWEKHDSKPLTVVPIAVPTANPFPKNSELNEDAQSLSAIQQHQSTGAGSQSSHSHSRNSYSGYNANVNSASVSQSQQHSAYDNLQHSSGSGSDSAASSQGTYTSGVGLDTTNQIEDVNNKPRSYHSSYSYHKSWERQGDPYVIKPASAGYVTQASQRLTSASSNQGAWSSRRYGSNYEQSHQNELKLEDCDENGHIRVARSYNSNPFEDQNTYQQGQYNYEEALNQQSQNLEDLGQQTQSQWDKLEDVAQQSQSQWDKIEDLGQQTQSTFDQIEDLGQQTQNTFGKIEDLGQQTQNTFGKIEDLGQQTQNTFDKTEDFGQQTQNNFDKIENLGQQTQTQWDKFEDAGQQTQSNWNNFGQQTQLDGQQLQNTWDQLESGSHTVGVGQETQNNWNSLNIEQQDKSIENIFKNEEKLTDTNPIPATEQKPWTANVQFQSNKPNWEQSDKENIPASTYNNFNWFNPMKHTDSNQPHTDFFNQQSYTYNNGNNDGTSYSDSHSQHNWDESYFNHRHTIDTSTQNTAEGSTLWNLWNKVDTIEKQTISSKNSSTTVSEPLSGNEFNITTSNSYNSPVSQVVTDESFTSSTASTDKIKETTTTSPTTKDNKLNQDKKLQPSDVGRGDISPEDSLEPDTDTEEVNGFGAKPIFGDFVATRDDKKYQTPAEIEGVHLVVVSNDKPASDVTNNYKDESQPKLISPPGLARDSNDDLPTQRNSPNGYWHHQNEEINIDLVQQTDNTSQQNGISMHNLNNNNFIQSTQTTDGQNHNVGQYNGNTATVEIEQSNVDKLHDQHSENFDQQNLQQSEKLNKEIFQQQSETFVHPENIVYPHTANILKQNGSINSLSHINEQTQYVMGTGSHTIPALTVTNPRPTENTETGKKPSGEFEIVNSDILDQQFSTHDVQHSENDDKFYSQNTGQELENFDQQSNNFDQQNTDQQFENFDQQIGKEDVNMEQQFETLTQQINTFDNQDTQQSFINLGTQNKDTSNNLENIYKPPVISDSQQTEQQFEHLNKNYEGRTVPVHRVEDTESERDNSYIEFEQHNDFLEQAEDLGQQVQTARKPYNNLNERSNVQEIQNLEVIPVDEPVFKHTITEEKAQKPQITLDTESTTQHTAPIDMPTETDTNKPGFWKSVGNKFVSAKDKVFSWFGSG